MIVGCAPNTSESNDAEALWDVSDERNKNVMDELNKVIDSGIDVVYVPGNHDLLLESGILKTERFLHRYYSRILKWEYFLDQAKVQYLENSKENVDIIVFGQTHVLVNMDLGNGIYYVNSGIWIDHNSIIEDATRTFAVITTGPTSTANLHKYMEDGTIIEYLVKP